MINTPTQSEAERLQKGGATLSALAERRPDGLELRALMAANGASQLTLSRFNVDAGQRGEQGSGGAAALHRVPGGNQQVAGGVEDEAGQRVTVRVQSVVGGQ